jgi:hypothetical protein
MARSSTKIPPLGRFGGVRMVQRRIGRSETLHQHKEAVAAELLSLGTANITDIVNLDGTVKPLDQIPEHALRAIKRISATKDGVTIEMFDKVAVLRVLAKASGMLDVEKNEDKPSIVGINMKGPTTTYEIEEDNGSESSGSEQSDTGSEDTD